MRSCLQLRIIVEHKTRTLSAARNKVLLNGLAFCGSLCIAMSLTHFNFSLDTATQCGPSGGCIRWCTCSWLAKHGMNVAASFVAATACAASYSVRTTDPPLDLMLIRIGGCHMTANAGNFQTSMLTPTWLESMLSIPESANALARYAPVTSTLCATRVVPNKVGGYRTAGGDRSPRKEVILRLSATRSSSATAGSFLSQNGTTSGSADSHHH